MVYTPMGLTVRDMSDDEEFVETLELGKRYQLPHGIGKLVAREIPDPNKYGWLIHNYESLRGPISARYIFEIEPCEWSEIMNTTCYGAWRRDIGAEITDG